MNARATDFIQIAGFQDGAQECFAALGSPSAPAYSTSVTVPGTTPGTTPVTPTPVVDKIPADLQKWIDSMESAIGQVAPWIDSAVDIAAYNWDQEKANPEDDSTERGLTRDVGGLPAPVLRPVPQAPRVPRDPATLLTIWVNAGGGGAGTAAVIAYLVTSYGAEWVEAWIRKKFSKGDDVAEFKAELLDSINALAYQEQSVQLGRAARVDVKSGILKYF